MITAQQKADRKRSAFSLSLQQKETTSLTGGIENLQIQEILLWYNKCRSANRIKTKGGFIK